MPESYPWPEHNVTPVTLKHKACYWMVTGLYADMRANGLSDAELRRKVRMTDAYGASFKTQKKRFQSRLSRFQNLVAGH